MIFYSIFSKQIYLIRHNLYSDSQSFSELFPSVLHEAFQSFPKNNNVSFNVQLLSTYQKQTTLEYAKRSPDDLNLLVFF